MSSPWITEVQRHCRRHRGTDGSWTSKESSRYGCTGNERRQRHGNDPVAVGPIPSWARVAPLEGMCWADAGLPSGIGLELRSDSFNHVLKNTRSSTHGCQHMVERSSPKPLRWSNAIGSQRYLGSRRRKRSQGGSGWGDRRAGGIPRHPSIRRPSPTVSRAPVSGVCRGRPSSRSQLAGDWSGRRRDHSSGCRTSVQRCGQGA